MTSTDFSFVPLLVILYESAQVAMTIDKHMCGWANQGDGLKWNGLTISTSGKSWMFRVAIVRPHSRAVAASMPSTTGTVCCVLRVPHRSAIESVMGMMSSR